jgi:hypothetical protein
MKFNAKFKLLKIGLTGHLEIYLKIMGIDRPVGGTYKRIKFAMSQVMCNFIENY